MVALLRPSRAPSGTLSPSIARYAGSPSPAAARGTPPWTAEQPPSAVRRSTTGGPSTPAFRRAKGQSLFGGGWCTLPATAAPAAPTSAYQQSECRPWNRSSTAPCGLPKRHGSSIPIGVGWCDDPQATERVTPVSAALVCFRLGLTQVTFWADGTEAAEADRVLSPCDKGCEMQHSIVETVGTEDYRVTASGQERA